MEPITTAEAAALVERSVGTINRWVAEGRLSPVRKMPGLRGAHLFDPAAVREAAAERETKAS